MATLVRATWWLFYGALTVALVLALAGLLLGAAASF